MHKNRQITDEQGKKVEGREERTTNNPARQRNKVQSATTAFLVLLLCHHNRPALMSMANVICGPKRQVQPAIATCMAVTFVACRCFVKAINEINFAMTVWHHTSHLSLRYISSALRYYIWDANL